MSLDVAGFFIELLTLIAIGFAALQLVGDRTQRHREFENLYVQRYWNLLDEMSNDLYLRANEEYQSSPSDKRLIVAYLRLCEDEIDVRRQGFVTDRTWEIWAAGIRGQMQDGPYKRQLKEIGSDLPSLHDFAKTGADPLKWKKMKKWWSGLC